MEKIPKISFLTYIKPLLILGRCFGTIFYPISNSNTTSLMYLSQLPIIICFLRWCFMASKEILIKKFMNTTDVMITSFVVFHICVCWDTFSRYLIYFLYRKRIKEFLIGINTLDKSLNIDRSKSPHLYKQVTVFLTFMLSGTAVSLVVLVVSSLKMPSIERHLFYCLYFFCLSSDTFLVKILSNQLCNLFSNINKNIRIKDVNSVINLSNDHLKLSELILENNDLFNTSILGTLLTIFISITNTIAVIVSNAKIFIRKDEVNPIFVTWKIAVCVLLLRYTWYLIKLRMDLAEAVS